VTPVEPTGLAPASQSRFRSARRLVRRKERAVAGRFIAEGPQSVREALARPTLVESVFVASSAAHRHDDLIDTALTAGISVSRLSDRDLAALSETVTPQGVVAVCRALDVPLAVALAGSPRLVVCCAQVRDPGNAGTVIRCADAFGADAVVLSHGSVDAYNAKTVRASVGSLFHVPVAIESDTAAAVARLRLSAEP